jgi:molybdopterin converting factor small subunit
VSGKNNAVEVHLYGKLRRFSSVDDPICDSVVTVCVKTGDTIEDIVERIGIPHEELGANVFLNGEYSGLAREVRAGDRLGLFPDDMQLLYKWYFRKIGHEKRNDQD